MSDPKKILIIGPSWVGDMVMAQTLFMVIKQRHPEVELDVLAPPWCQPLLSRMPEINKGLVSPFQHGELCLRRRFRFAKELRNANYDQAIVLPNSYKSALIPLWAKIPLRTGWVGEKRWGVLNDTRTLDKKVYPLMVQRFVALALPKNAEMPTQIPSPRLVSSKADVEAALQRLQMVKPDKPVLALCPGAEFGGSKRWPAAYYAEVARDSIAQGWDVWLFGSENDRVITNQVNIQAGGGCLNLAGKTSLSEAVDLFSLVDVAVTNDSGLMHIANAVGCQSVVVYGSSSPRFTPPLSSRAEIIKSKLECSPCFKRECPLGHHDCMKNIKPDKVLKVVARLNGSVIQA